MTVSDNGGSTAAELGFSTFKATTLLSSLNKGVGVSTAGTGTQFVDRYGRRVDASTSG